MVVGISAFIFAMAGLAALGSVGFIFIEQLRVRRFDEPIFRLGWIVVRQRLALPAPSADLVSVGTIEKEEGMFTFVDHCKCLFAPKWRWFSLGRGRRTFTLKGTAIWDRDGAEITVRMTLGPTLFCLSWLVGWTAASVLALVLKSVGEAFLTLLFGWMLAVMIALSHIRVERKSLNSMLAELAAILGG